LSNVPYQSEGVYRVRVQIHLVDLKILKEKLDLLDKLVGNDADEAFYDFKIKVKGRAKIFKVGFIKMIRFLWFFRPPRHFFPLN
jgi:cell fate regulator YaaT (PSP1 superfamily)